jgi:hypothetical protein
LWEGNVAVYLVTYDLNRETIRPKITDIIYTRFDGYAKLSESSYAIETAAKTDAVYRMFEGILDDNDQLYVITLTKPYSGQGTQEVNDWLESTLPD